MPKDVFQNFLPLGMFQLTHSLLQVNLAQWLNLRKDYSARFGKSIFVGARDQDVGHCFRIQDMGERRDEYQRPVRIATHHLIREDEAVSLVVPLAP